MVGGGRYKAVPTTSVEAKGVSCQLRIFKRAYFAAGGCLGDKSRLYFFPSPRMKSLMSPVFGTSPFPLAGARQFQVVKRACLNAGGSWVARPGFTFPSPLHEVPSESGSRILFLWPASYCGRRALATSLLTEAKGSGSPLGSSSAR